MRWASSISDEPELGRAAAEVLAGVDAQLQAAAPDLLFAFVSHSHRRSYEDLGEILSREFPEAVIVGSSARSVIGDGRELEEVPGIALAAATLPDVALRAFHLDRGATPAPEAWRDLLDLPTGTTPHFVLLADPFTTGTERLIRDLDQAFPRGVKVGGLSSGGDQPGETALFLGSDVHALGSVGVALWGDLEVDAIVAQGCRPIGVPMFVTRCHENLLLELDGRSAASVLQDLYASLSPEDRDLVRTSLFVGIVMRRDQIEYGPGDFLIRNLVGVDEERGSIVVAAQLEEAQVIQFHLRDARTSGEELNQSLLRYREASRGSAPAGALLFSCLGRGELLYGESGHDSSAFHRHLGAIPLGGFFCNGEIGPVRGRTYLHGYTSSFGIFRPRAQEGDRGRSLHVD